MRFHFVAEYGLLHDHYWAAAQRKSLAIRQQ